MVLVPLGISLGSWTRSIDPKSKSRSAGNGSVFTDDTGSHSFHRVGGTSHGTSGKKDSTGSKLSRMIKPKMTSPVQQMLEQTKEKEKRADAPDTSLISLNVASTSSGAVGKMKKRMEKNKKISKSDSKKKSNSSIKRGDPIKRLQRKRKSQSNKNLGRSNKSYNKSSK